VPLSENPPVMVADIAAMLNLPILIVARAGLGTINHTLLTLQSARQWGLTIWGIVLNFTHPDGQDLAEITNPDALRCWGEVEILAQLPEDPETQMEAFQIGPDVLYNLEQIKLP